nr:MAG TPA: hypothetical protein [Bacteriophage sp.]
MCYVHSFSKYHTVQTWIDMYSLHLEVLSYLRNEL